MPVHPVGIENMSRYELGIAVQTADRLVLVLERRQRLDETPVTAHQEKAVEQTRIAPEVGIVHLLLHLGLAVEERDPATDILVARQHIVPDIVIPYLRLIQVEPLEKRQLRGIAVLVESRAEELLDHVQVLLRPGITQLKVQGVKLHPGVRQLVDVLDPAAQFDSLPARRLALGHDSPGDTQRVHLLAEIDDVDRGGILLVGKRRLLGLVEHLGTLPEKALVVEYAGEVDLLAELHRNRPLHVQQTDADQYLLIQMGLHVRQLFLLDRTALQNLRLVVFVERVHAVEQRDELRLLIARKARRVELEVPLLGFTHASYQVEYGLLFSAGCIHRRACFCRQQIYQIIIRKRN